MACFRLKMSASRYISLICFLFLLYGIYKLNTIKLGYSSTFEFSKCDYFCGEFYKECFKREMTVIVYKDVVPNKMSFKQYDQYYVRNKTILDVLRGKRNYKTSGKSCKITDVDPSFSTLERHKRCAIVGNSGILLKSRCGSIIDNFNFVMRANLAPVNGFEEDVGLKTSMMMINDEILGRMYTLLMSARSTDQESIIKQLRSLNDTILWYPKDSTTNNAFLRSVGHILHMNSIKTKLAYSFKDIASDIKWKYNMWSYPSSGLYMYTLATTFCDHITLFGFYPYEKDEFGQKLLHHYYEPNLTNFKTWAHNFNTEYQMLSRMRDNGDLQMITNPCVPKDRLA